MRAFRPRYRCPHWRPPELARLDHRLAAFEPWLRLHGSMTWALASAWPSVRVVVHAEGWGRATRDERRWLAMRHGRRCWCREVTLRSGRHDLVHARTVAVPRSRRALQALRHLGDRPLAQLLFARPGARLEHRGVAAVQPQAHAPPRPVRRTRYRLHGEPLIVSETLALALAGSLPHAFGRLGDGGHAGRCRGRRGGRYTRSGQ